MDFIKKIYLYYIVLFSGYATQFFRSKVGLIITFIIGLFLFIRETISPKKKLLVALLIWVSYFIINLIVIKSFHPFFLFTYIANISIAYWLLSYYKADLFKKYEDIIYFLSIVSLAFYVINILFPNQLEKLMDIINLSGGLFSEINYKSIIFYTINKKNDSILRNSGFCWEPGPYSCFIAVAIFIYLARNKFIIKDKNRILVLLISLISTMSTSGYLAIMIIFMWYIIEKKSNKLIFPIIFIIILANIIFLYFKIPFMHEKVLNEFKQDLDVLLINSIRYNKSYAPGRIVGLRIGLKDFKSFPITGYGGNTGLRYGFNMGAEVVAINGIANIMGRYGSIGLIILFLIIFKTSCLFKSYFRYKYKFAFPLIILIIGFSFGILESIILFTILMSGYYLNNGRSRYSISSQNNKL